MSQVRTGEVTSDRYRSAVSSVIRTLQKIQQLSDAQTAARLECSTGTIRNARNGLTSLDPLILTRIEREFGPGAIDPVLALANARSVPLPSAKPTVDPVLAIVEALHRIIEVQAVDSDGGMQITPSELRRIILQLRQGRTALDMLIARADGLDLQIEE